MTFVAMIGPTFASQGWAIARQDRPNAEMVLGIWITTETGAIRHCAAVLLMPDWEPVQAKPHLDEAHRLGLPIFDEMARLTAWLDQETA